MNNETFIATLEEKRADALEMAKKAHEEGKEKAQTKSNSVKF